MGISMIAAYRYLYIVIFLCLCRLSTGSSQPETTLSPCTDESLFANCIEHDTTGDIYHLADNITATLIIQLPVPVLTELWEDQSKVAILTSDDEIINNGQQIIDSQDRDRWTLDFMFKKHDNGYGKFILTLRIRDVKYRDTRLLHIEIRSRTATFKTKGRTWISVPGPGNDNNEDTTDHKMKVLTTQNHTSYTDAMVVLKEQNDALKQNISALQKMLLPAEDDVVFYQKFKRYIRSLETANATKEKSEPSQPSPDIRAHVTTGITVVFIQAATCTIMLCIHVYWNYKHEKAPLIINGNEIDKDYILERGRTAIIEYLESAEEDALDENTGLVQNEDTAV